MTLVHNARPYAGPKRPTSSYAVDRRLYGSGRRVTPGEVTEQVAGHVSVAVAQWLRASAFQRDQSVSRRVRDILDLAMKREGGKP